jgi:histidyl-tRNA synthetase
MNNLDSYKGVRDFYPQDMNNLNYIIDNWKKTLKKFGYEEYNASILEPTELYEAKSSDEIVSEQTYNFIDRGDRRVTLRPEMTPTLSRMIAKKSKELSLPVRWFSVPNVFRYEQPQRGRLREHWQLNVDLLGLENKYGDSEIIQIAYEIMKDFGLNESDFVIRINNRKNINQMVKSLDLPPEKEKDFFKLLDKKDKMVDFNDEMFKLIGKPLNISMGPSEEIEKIFEILNKRGITNLVFDPYLVRGFDYYTGIVFEIYDTNSINKRAIFGGGRYDNLIGQFGSENISGIGFGMGDVTIQDVLEIRKLLPNKKNNIDVYICLFNEESSNYANQISNILRENEINTIIDYSFKRISNQIEKAVKKNSIFTIFIGEEEVKTQRIKIKNLNSGIEKKLKIRDLVKFVKKELSS